MYCAHMHAHAHTNLFGVLVNAHDAAPTDPQQPRHQLVPSLQLLLHQEEGHTIGGHATALLDVAELGVEFTHGIVLAILLDRER